MALGNLKVTLDLIADGFVSGVRSAEKELAGLGRVMTSSEFTTGAQAIGLSFIGMGTAIGGALLLSAKNAANYGNAMLDASQKTGISTEKLAGYKLLADQSGTSFQALNSGLGTLSKNMVAAATGNEKQARFFSALGISVKDSSGNIRNLSDVVPEFADRIAGMGDGALKSAVATQAFGKAVGPELIPFLQGGSAAMDKAAESAHKFGLDISNADAVMSSKFNASLVETKAAIYGLSDSVGIVLLPQLTNVVTKINDVIASTTQWSKANPIAAESLAGLSVALIGGGGLIVGLTTVLALIPSVNAGLIQIGVSGGIASGGLGLLITAMAAVSTAGTYFTAKKIVGLLPDPQAVGLSIRESMGLSVPEFTEAPRLGPKFGPPGLPADWMQLSRGSAGDEEMRKLLADLEKKGKADQAAKEMERFRASVATLMQTITGTTPPSKELVTAIHKLDAAGQMSSATILELAKHIDTLKNSNDPLIQQYVKMIPLLQLAGRLQADQAKLVDEATKNRPDFDLLTLPVDMTMPDSGPFAAGDIRGNQIQQRAKDARDSLSAQGDEIRILSGAITELSRQNLSATEIEQALGISLGDVAERARELGVEINPLIEKMARTHELSESWGDSMGSISDKLVDMIVDFDFSFKRLGDIAKSTAKDMGRSFLDGLFSPFKQGLKGLGKEAGDWLGGLVFGGGSAKKEGGLLSGLFSGGGLGGLLGGLFGKGKNKGGPGDWLGNVIPGMDSLGAALKGPGGGGLFGGLLGAGGASGLMGTMNPIGAGLSIAQSALNIGKQITGMIGSGRDSANEIVKSQNAFVNETLKGILSDDSLSATNKLKQVNSVWEAFQANLGRFSAAGGEGGVTANQAFATVSPLVSNIQRDLMKEGATDAAGGGNVINGDVNISFVLPEGITPEGWLDWLYKNKAGIGTAITENVLAMQGAIVAR